MHRMDYLIVSLLAASLLAGCDQGKSGPAPDGENGTTEGKAAAQHDHEGHTHAAGEVLFWQRDGIEAHGFKIKLGHHGVRVHAGHPIEPAVAVARDAADVAEAKVFVSLLGADKKTVLVAEKSTVFEPKSADEPAHYAQASLDVPEQLDRLTVRYRIVLPGDAGEVSYDVPLVVEQE